MIPNSEQSKIKVLAVAYACEPNLGSEPEVGWQWVKQIAKRFDVWVVTRESNRAAIEKELQKNPTSNLHFVYFDLPKWLRFWKKGRRGIHLYYILWQAGAYFKIKELREKINFSIAHHITFVNSWLPSVLAWTDIPFIWGPIGRQHIPLSIPLMKEFGFRGGVSEVLRNVIYKIAKINPLVKHTFKKAKRIVAINQLILEQNRKYEAKMDVVPAIAVAEELSCSHEKTLADKTDIVVMFGGAAMYLKGITLAVKAFIGFSKNYSNVRMVIAGDGPLLANIKNKLNKSGLGNRVDILGHLRRDIFLTCLSSCDIFLYPSFEGGGLVVLEAMACGKPVVCLDTGGPGEFVSDECGIKIKVSDPEKMVYELGIALNKLACDGALRVSMGAAGYQRVKELYQWGNIGKLIEEIYSEVLA